MELEKTDFVEVYNEHIIEKFKDIDYENYEMYRTSGLTDDEIVSIITQPSLESIYDFSTI